MEQCTYRISCDCTTILPLRQGVQSAVMIRGDVVLGAANRVVIRLLVDRVTVLEFAKHVKTAAMT